jgi:hypothetical protein
MRLEKVLDENPDHKEANQFLDAHHLEFVEILKDEKAMIMKLLYLDPEHEETYRKLLN